MKEVAVIAPQYFLQGDQLCGGRAVGSLVDLAHEFLLFFRRQILEHDLIVKVCQGCAFGECKELGGEPFMSQLIEQVPAGCEDACFVIPKGRVKILELHKAVPAGIKNQTGSFLLGRMEFIVRKFMQAVSG